MGNGPVSGPSRHRPRVRSAKPKRIDRLFVSLAVALLPAAAAAPPAGAQQPLQGAVSAQIGAAGGWSGAWAADTEGGRPIAAVRATARRIPASVQKLLTTATALERFGEEIRLETAALADGELDEEGTLDGDLYVKGAGDPSLGGAGLARLAAEIEKAGVARVSGSILGDESYFDRRRGVPASGFAVSRWIGPLSALAFNRGMQPGGVFQSDPGRYVAGRMRALLESRGVDVEGTSKAGRAPRSSEELASVGSPPLASLVRHTNQVSDNYYAETLLKGLGARFGGAGSTAAGAGAVRRFGRTIGIAPRVVDGSGLSRANTVSPRSVGHLLLEAENRPWFQSFYRSLPLAGRTGTLRKRMRGTAAQGRCRAKTGTLIGVSGLAGFCRARNGHLVAFAVLMNGVNVYTARRAQDRMAAALARYSG